MENGKRRLSHPGELGTLRWIRRFELNGISQDRFGRNCSPRLKQPQISEFEMGTLWLTWDMAGRIAPALDAGLFKRNVDAARAKVFRVWLRCVEACNPSMFAEAVEYAKASLSWLPGELWLHAAPEAPAPLAQLQPGRAESSPKAVNE